MDNEYLRKKKQEFLEKYKGSSQYFSMSSVITRFVEYIEATGKDLKDFNTNDFEGFLKNFSNKNTIGQVKSKIQAFSIFCGCDKGNLPVASEIEPELSYILSFEELKNGIDKVREEQYKSLGIDLCDIPQCDDKTLGEVVLYLAWLGIPRDMVARLPLSAINLEKRNIEYDEDSIKRTFSFADYPAIEEVFTKYKNAKYFTSCRNRNNQLLSLNYDYYGDNVIRPCVPPKNDNSIVANLKHTLNRIFKAFKFAGDYNKVFLSGAFSRGYEKIIQGSFPEFTPIGVMDFFGVAAESDSFRRNLKRQWKDYLQWRLALEGKELNVSPDKARITKMRKIAADYISALNSFPKDVNTKIEMTAGELDSLMLAIYNFWKNGS